MTTVALLRFADGCEGQHTPQSNPICADWLKPVVTYGSRPCCAEGNCATCRQCGYHLTGWDLNSCPDCAWVADA